MWQREISRMIGARPMDGPTTDGEDPIVSQDIPHLSINAQMAAERYRRLLAEAQQQRQVVQRERVGGRRFMRLGFVTALNRDVATWMGRYQVWRARWRHDRLSMSGTA